MRKFMFVLAILSIAGIALAGQVIPGKPRRLVLARQSTIPPPDVMKNLTSKCPSVILTADPKKSDFMLFAGGVPGAYQFMVIAKGGDTIYATKTYLLSNAVKDVCIFLSKQP